MGAVRSCQGRQLVAQHVQRRRRVARLHRLEVLLLADEEPASASVRVPTMGATCVRTTPTSNCTARGPPPELNTRRGPHRASRSSSSPTAAWPSSRLGSNCSAPSHSPASRRCWNRVADTGCIWMPCARGQQRPARAAPTTPAHLTACTPTLQGHPCTIGHPSWTGCCCTRRRGASAPKPAAHRGGFELLRHAREPQFKQRLLDEADVLGPVNHPPGAQVLLPRRLRHRSRDGCLGTRAQRSTARDAQAERAEAATRPHASAACHCCCCGPASGVLQRNGAASPHCALGLSRPNAPP